MAGVLLAAGAGSRMGGPKALLADADGRPWLVRGVDALRSGGVDHVVVVLGAAPEAGSVVADRDDVRVVLATDWHAGPDASLRAGLDALAADRALGHVTAAAVLLVDLPDVDGPVVSRVLAATGTHAGACGRAVHGTRPGHPVVLGRDLWSEAPTRRRDLLGGDGAVLVECGDLATGVDLDRPDQLPAGTVRLAPRPASPVAPATPPRGADAGDLPTTNRA